MKGLLIKDLYTLRNNGVTIIAFTIFAFAFSIWSGDGGWYITLMLTLMIMMYGVTSFSYDEKSTWIPYSMALPTGRKKLVLAKFAYVGLLAALCLAIGLTNFTINLLIGGLTAALPMLATSFTITALFSTAQCINIPLIYKFGVEKIRTISTVTYLVPFGIFILPLVIWGNAAAAILTGPLALGIVLVMCIVAFFAGYNIAIHIVIGKDY